jgi:ribosomal protein S14
MSFICDGCRYTISLGEHFRCTVRNDFDLCRNCFDTWPQPYPMKPMCYCDGCYNTITGERFHCTIRDNFDLCRVCFDTMPQPYPLKMVLASAVHFANCDDCQMSPITGPRYRCTVRNDYDLCSKCEEKFQQPYPMTKIYTAEQYVPETTGRTFVTSCDVQRTPGPQSMTNKFLKLRPDVQKAALKVGGVALSVFGAAMTGSD